MRGAAAIKYFGVDDKSLQVWVVTTFFAFCCITNHASTDTKNPIVTL